jgi:hypothetical protein
MAKAVATVGGAQTAPTTLEELMASYQTAETEARQKQLSQADLVRKYLQQIVDIYSPEGAYLKGMEMQLARQKVTDVGAAAQRGISSGLYGIRPYEEEWESAVGGPARAKLEDIRLERSAQALSGLAQFEAGIEYTPPDYSALMEAAAAGYGTPRTTGWTFAEGAREKLGTSWIDTGYTGTKAEQGTGLYRGPEYETLMKERQKMLAETEMPVMKPFTEEEEEEAKPETTKATPQTGTYELVRNGTTYRVSNGVVSHVKMRSTGKWYPVGYPKSVEEYFK